MKIIKYFFEFIIIITFFSIFKLIGYRNASNLGEKIGKIFGPLFRSSHVIQKNLENLNDSYSHNEKKNIIKNMWGNYGRIFAEYMYLEKFRNNVLSSNIEINGQKILDEIKSKKEPVIFVSGHFNNFELMAMHLEKSGINLAAIYRPLNNKFLNPLMEKLRKKYICQNQIKKGYSGIRESYTFLKNNFNLALMIDQRVSEGENIKLFNRNALTTTLPAQIALRFSCDIIPIYIKRKENDRFEMEIYKPILISDFK